MANEWQMWAGILAAQQNNAAAQAQADKQYQIGQQQLDWAKEQEAKYAPYNQKILDAQLDSYAKTNAASERAAKAAEEQLAIARENNQWTKDAQAKYDPYIQQILDSQMASQKQASDFAQQQQDFYNNYYMPREKAYLEEVSNYGNAEDQKYWGAKAAAGVTNMAEHGRQAALRELESYGIKPGDGGFTSTDIRARTDTAAQAAGQSTATMQGLYDKGIALRGGALAGGQNAIGNFTNAIGMGSNIGASALGGANNSLSAGAGARGAVAGMYGVGNSAINSEIGGIGSGANIGSAAAGAINNWTGTNSNLRNSAAGWYGQGNNIAAQGYNSLNNLSNNLYQTYAGSQNKSSGMGALLGAGIGMGASILGNAAMPGGGSAFGALAQYGLGKFGFGPQDPQQKKPSFAEGGAVPSGPIVQDGGAIPTEASPSRGAETDDINARLNAGEFVFPADAVAWYGEKHMYGLVDKAKREREQYQSTTETKPQMMEAIPGPPAFVSRSSAGSAIPA